MPQGPWTDHQKQLVRSKATQYGVDPDLVDAMVQQESGYENAAVSSANARGLMQLMPATAHELGVTDLHDPTQNVDAGVRYLKQMLDRFGGDTRLALAAYNAGPGAVEKAGRQVPNIPETQDYVDKITARIGSPTEGPWTKYQPTGQTTSVSAPSSDVSMLTPLAQESRQRFATQQTADKPKPFAEMTPGEVAWRQTQNVAKGISGAFTGVPGFLFDLASSGVDLLTGDPEGAINLAKGAVESYTQPIGTVARGVGALAGLTEAPTQEDWEQAAQAAGGQAGAALLGEVGSAYVKGRWPRRQGRSIIKQPVDLLRDALGKPTMEDSAIQMAGDELKRHEVETGKTIKDYDTAKEAVSNRMQLRNQQEAQMLQNVGSTRVPSSIINEFQARVAAIPDTIRIQTPDVYNNMVLKIRDEIVSRGGQGPSISELNDLRHGLNKEVQQLKSLRGDRALAADENARLQDLEAQSNHVRNTLYDTLNQIRPGMTWQGQIVPGAGDALRAINEPKGALIGFENWLQKVEGKARSEAAQSVVERGRERFGTLRITDPVFRPWYVAEKTFGRSKTVNNLIANAMRNWGEPGTGPTPFNVRATPPTPPQQPLGLPSGPPPVLPSGPSQPLGLPPAPPGGSLFTGRLPGQTAPGSPGATQQLPPGPMRPMLAPPAEAPVMAPGVSQELPPSTEAAPIVRPEESEQALPEYYRRQTPMTEPGQGATVGQVPTAPTGEQTVTPTPTPRGGMSARIADLRASFKQQFPGLPDRYIDSLVNDAIVGTEIPEAPKGLAKNRAGRPKGVRK